MSVFEFGPKTRIRYRNHLNELGCNVLTLSHIYSSHLQSNLSVDVWSVDKAFEELKKEIYDFTTDDSDYSQTAIVNISPKWCDPKIFEVFRKFPNHTEIITKGAHKNPPCTIFILPLEGIRWQPEGYEEPDFEPDDEEEEEENA